MKRLLLLSLIAIAFAYPVCASSYEIRLIGNIPLTDNLTAIAVNPTTGIAAAVSSDSKTLYLIDTNSNAVTRKIPLDMIPSAVAVDDRRNSAIVSSEKGAIHFIDLDSGVLLKAISSGWDIYSIAVDKDGDSIYLGNGGSILVMALETGKIIREVRSSHKVIGMDMDDTLNYLVMVMEGKDGLTIYNSVTFELITEINPPSPPFSKGGLGGFSGVSANPSTHIAVLTNRTDNSLSIVSLENRAVLNTLPFDQPGAVAIDPTRNIALITHKGGIAVVRFENPVPGIESLVPESAKAGSAGLSLSIKGSRFIRDSRARFDLKELDTLFEDNYNLKAIVPSEELLSARDVPVTVLNPGPGGGISNSLLFRIINPVPQIESIAPDAVAFTASPTELRIRGKNFLPGSIVNLNGRNLVTKFISSILLSAKLDLSGIKIPAKYPLTVINPSPLTLTSNVAFLDVVEDETSLTLKKKEAELKEKSEKTVGSLTGRILNTYKQPIEGVTVQIKNIKAETNSAGYFTLGGVPSGKQHLMIKGSSAKDKEGLYPTIPLTVNIEPDRINEMPFQIYLHKQKNRNFKDIKPNEDTILTDPEIPGFEMKIPKGVKITGWDGKPNTKVSVRTVPPDRLPVKPLPDNANTRSVYMFYFGKEGGGIPDQPIPNKVPNDLGLLPSEKAILWYYDESPNEGEAPNDWAIAGTGTVTPDGQFIVSDPGVGIPKFCCGAIVYGGSGAGSGGSGPNGGCGESGCCGGGGGGGAGGGNGGGGGPGGPQVSGTAGDPVDLATGYFIYRRTDYRVLGIIPVEITRHYRTGDNGYGGYGVDTYFGYDWWIGDYGDMLLLLIPGNYQYRFYKDVDGSFKNDTDPKYAGDRIYKNADGTYLLRKKNGWKYKFNSSRLLIGIEDPNGNALTFLREIEGNVTKIIMPDGKLITFDIVIRGRDNITKITGPAGTVTYNYINVSFTGQLQSVVYHDGSSVIYEYDTSGRMTKITENGKLVVTNEYDSSNRVIRQTHSDGGTYTFNYTVAGGNVTETRMTAPNGGTTTWRFNNYKYITDVTTPDGTTAFEREPGSNRILSVTDPLGRRMSYVYDTKGRITAITDNAGNATAYEYEDTNSKVTKVTDALVNVTNMTYDSKGNLLTLTTPDNKTTTFSYNSIGNPLTVTDALGNVTTMQYDTSGDLIRVTDPLGNFSTMDYDSLNRLTTMTDAKGKSTLYNYDAMGRITDVTDPIGNITRYGYSLDGKLSVVQDAKNHDIRYDYDSRGRLVKMTDQLGKIETYNYDTSDNLSSIIDRKGQTTTYTYDLMNRLTRATYADGGSTSYTYDAVGKVLSITDSVSGTISYTYSGSGCGIGCNAVPDKVIQEAAPLGTVSYTYDAIGRRTSMTVAGQPTVNYTYDVNNRLTSVVGAGLASAQISYDALGRRTSLTLPNGVTTNYAYDNASHLLEMKHLNPAQQVLESLTYAYDATGNRISMNRPSVSLPLPNAVSNTSYNEANQMLTFNTKNMTYDNNGNMTSVTNTCGTTTYTWDARNRLVGIGGFKPDCSPLSASFRYDALGRRIEKTINGTNTKYLYDGLDIVQEIQGTAKTNYIRTMNIDEPLARIKADGTIRYYQQDALGSIIGLSTVNGELSTVYAYDPFGNTTITGEASDNPFQYTGRENDGTGLYYYRARYYSPDLQRFISEDPILRPFNFASIGYNKVNKIRWLLPQIIRKSIDIPHVLNSFNYVGNNPINYKDQFGLDRYEWCGGEDAFLCKCLTDWGCSIMSPEYCCKVDFTDCMNKAKSDKEQEACALEYSFCLAKL